MGDPFKDTSGPSMNILIKLMSIVSLVIAPTLAQVHKTSIVVKTPAKNIEIKANNTSISANQTAELGNAKTLDLTKK